MRWGAALDPETVHRATTQPRPGALHLQPSARRAPPGALGAKGVATVIAASQESGRCRCDCGMRDRRGRCVGVFVRLRARIDTPAFPARSGRRGIVRHRAVTRRKHALVGSALQVATNALTLARAAPHTYPGNPSARRCAFAILDSSLTLVGVAVPGRRDPATVVAVGANWRRGWCASGVEARTGEGASTRASRHRVVHRRRRTRLEQCCFALGASPASPR